jgi:signal transduction histidine kinase
MKRFLFFGILFYLFFSCDKKEDVQSVNQKKIIKYYNKIVVRKEFKLDSLIYFSNKITQLAQNENNEFKTIAQIAKNVVDTDLGYLNLVDKNCKESIKLLPSFENDTIKAKFYLVFGICKYNKGELDYALKYNFKALKIYEDDKKINGMANAFNKIADVYFSKNDFKSSILFLNKSLTVLKQRPKSKVRFITFHTLANIYGMSGNFKEALKIDNSCLKIAEKINSNEMKVLFLDNKANCFMYSNRLDSAKYYFEKCLVLDKVIGNPKQIADNYSNQAILYSMQNDFPKAEKFGLESITILKKIDNKTNLLNSYESLAEVYTKQGKFNEALNLKNEYIKTYKTLISEKKESASAEFAEIYESEKKQKQIVQQKAETKQKTNQLIIASILALAFLIIGFLIYKQQKQKNQQQAQENDLKLAIEKIENQNKLQEQRLNISRDLHDNIGSQLTFIISSVDNVKYGFDITNEKLDNKLTNISSFAKETILELRDTIWAMNSNEIAFKDLEIRINNFIEKAKLSKENISFSFAIDENLKQQKLSSVEGMNIYRTIQEAINNAIKYAEADVISVIIKQQANQTAINIKDNGKGFDLETTEKGNGLNNMKKRIEEIDGTFNLISGIDGTKIVVLI